MSNPTDVLITTDGRGRCNLSKVGADKQGRYSVRQFGDGTLVLSPVRVETMEELA